MFCTYQNMFIPMCCFSCSCLFLDHWFATFFIFVYVAKRMKNLIITAHAPTRINSSKGKSISVCWYFKGNHKHCPGITETLPYPDQSCKGDTEEGAGEDGKIFCWFCHKREHTTVKQSFLAQHREDLVQSTLLVSARYKYKRKRLFFFFFNKARRNS